MGEHGHVSAAYARACATGNYLIASGLAAQLRPLALAEALLLLPLIADSDPGRYDAAAVRWHTRWQLEHRDVDQASSALALAALSAVRSQRTRKEALRLLTVLAAP